MCVFLPCIVFLNAGIQWNNVEHLKGSSDLAVIAIIHIVVIQQVIIQNVLTGNGTSLACSFQVCLSFTQHICWKQCYDSMITLYLLKTESLQIIQYNLKAWRCVNIQQLKQKKNNPLTKDMQYPGLTSFNSLYSVQVLQGALKDCHLEATSGTTTTRSSYMNIT